jgi:CBS domain-containing protein
MTSTARQFIESRPVYTVERGTSVQAAAAFMSEHNIGAVAVMDGTRLVGIFSERDVINRVVAKERDPGRTMVGDVMTKDIVVATVDESHDSCLRKMRKASCRHLPIVDGESLVGFISLRDLLQVEISEKDDALEFLNNYMFHVSPTLEKKYIRQTKP